MSTAQTGVSMNFYVNLGKQSTDSSFCGQKTSNGLQASVENIIGAITKVSPANH
jgi:hypothetical protein